MNQLIKMVFLILLLHILNIHSMQNNSILIYSEPFIIDGITLCGDIVKKIFARTALWDLLSLKRVCKHFDHMLNPTTIKYILCFTDTSIIHIIESAKKEFIENNFYYAELLINMLNKENYPIILNQAALENNLTLATLVLNRGANPNIKQWKNATPLSLAIHDKDMTMFKLLLNHNADIYQDSGEGYSVMDIALTKAKENNTDALKIILQKKGLDHPRYQERINKYLRFERKKNIACLCCSLIIAYQLINECIIF